MKIDAKTQSFDLDLNAMFRYMVENFVEKTEPQLSAIDMLRLNPYIGNQLKEILPNPMNMLQEDEGKKRLIRDAFRGKETTPHIASRLGVYFLARGLGISPLEVYKMPVSMALDFMAIHKEAERLQAEENGEGTKRRRRR